MNFNALLHLGIISGVDRTVRIEEENSISLLSNLIQTDATINPGNSGGPLINSRGEMIGLNTIKITTADNIGFAIPINFVKPIISKYLETGSFEEASIGIFAYDKAVIPYLNSDLNFNSGIYVAELLTGGPANLAGIISGDIITKIDNIEINKMSELLNYIYSKAPNDIVKLNILRGKEEITVNVTLGKK